MGKPKTPFRSRYLRIRMKEYDNETLLHVQKCELIILRDVTEICRRHNLSIFGWAGTGIGVLRHGGFVPWDDDIDVGLLASDYDKLIEIIQSDYSEKYSVINSDIDINYPFASTRIMLRGTQFCEEVLSDLPLDLGIFLDVYSFDPVADDEKLYRRQAWDAWFWSHIRMLLSIPNPVLPFRGWKAKLVRFVCKSASAVFNLLKIDKSKVYAKEKEARRRYMGTDTKRVAYLCDTNRFNQTYYLSDIFPLRELDFSGVKLGFATNLEQHLSCLYGDFMQLPPIECRKNHFPARLDFGRY